MLFESKRLLELAGIKTDESSNLLTEGSEMIFEFDNTDGVTEDSSCYEEESIEEEDGPVREAVRKEVERMWASGEVFGKTASKKHGVTMGFLGVGFKR